MSAAEERDGTGGIDETTQWQPSALGDEFAATHTIRSHRILDPRPARPRRTIMIGMVLLFLAAGVLVAQSAIFGGLTSPGETPRPGLTRGDALAGQAPSVSPPMQGETSAAPTTPGPSASPTPSPSTTRPTAPAAPAPSVPQPFAPFAVEAEAALLWGSASAVGCGACSGGHRVGYISADSSVVVRADIPQSGVRTVQVTYETDGLRQLKIQLNGTDVDVRWLVGDGWETPMIFEFSLTMPAGAVELRFYNDISPAPDIDRVALS